MVVRRGIDDALADALVAGTAGSAAEPALVEVIEHVRQAYRLTPAPAPSRAMGVVFRAGVAGLDESTRQRLRAAAPPPATAHGADDGGGAEQD